MEPTTVESRERREPSGSPEGGKSGGVPFFVTLGLLLVTLCSLGAFIYLRYLPEREAALESTQQLAESKRKLGDLEGRLVQAEQRLASTQQDRDRLDHERAKAVEEKDGAIKELERLKKELANSLEAELARGDVGLERRGQQLVLDVADKILFQLGEAEVSEGGKDVLARVAQALATRTDHVVQVRGHTDNLAITSPKTRELFPTNWELSTARATNVVRFLQDSGHIAGKRLMAAGFAQYRPVSSNKNEAGRRKNRRIEIVLLPAESEGGR